MISHSPSLSFYFLFSLFLFAVFVLFLTIFTNRSTNNLVTAPNSLCNSLLFERIQVIGTAQVMYASEKSSVDPQAKQMTLKTINLTFGRHISVDESLTYSIHPTDPTKTLLRQEATVNVRGVPLSYYMEDLLASSISANASKGRQGLEWVISKINSEVCKHRYGWINFNEFDNFVCLINAICCISGQRFHRCR